MRHALLATVGFLAARFLSAAITPIGAEIVVTQTNPAAAPAVAVLPSGAFVIAWQESAGGASGWDVWTRHYDEDGGALAAASRVNTTIAGCQRRPAIAADGNGQWVVAWQSDHGGEDRVFYRRFSSAGAPLDPAEIGVDLSATGEQASPAVATGANGGWLVAWQGRGAAQDPDSWGVYARAFDGAGTAAGDTSLVNQATEGAQHSPVATFLAADQSRFAVAWQAQGGDPSGSAVYRRTLATSGIPLTSEQLVNVTTAGSQRDPRVASDASGNFVVVWEDRPLAGPPVILSRRFHSSSVPITNENTVATASFLVTPAVASALGGDFLAAWSIAAADGELDLYRRAFDHQSLPLEPPQATAVGAGRQLAASAAAHASRVVMAWQSEEVGQPARVLARRFDVSGLGFFSVVPCRMVDTRWPVGPLGGPALTADVPRTFVLAGAACGIPVSARALSVNVTVLPTTGHGWLRLYPGDGPLPLASSVNFGPGQVRANNAVVTLSRDGVGTLKVLLEPTATSTAHFLLDVNGYFE